MTDKLLDKYTKRSAQPDSTAPDAEHGDAEDLGCFGWMRGVRDRAVMLQLRKKDGRVLAIGYAWLERVEFSPEQGITLHLPGRKIRMTGSGLNAETRPAVRLFDGLTRHRVSWVRESDRSERLHADTTTVMIEKLDWD